MIENLIGEMPKDWQAEASKIPAEELASWLRENNWLVVQPGLWVDPDEELDNSTRVSPIHLISQKSYHEDVVNQEDVKIRLSGSIRDQDLEEVIREGWDKHNWRLADKIADIL